MRAHGTGTLRLRADYFVGGEKNICFLRRVKFIKTLQHCGYKWKILLPLNNSGVTT